MVVVCPNEYVYILRRLSSGGETSLRAMFLATTLGLRRHFILRFIFRVVLKQFLFQSLFVSSFLKIILEFEKGLRFNILT